jgi:mono/diheme cytochrome c family protein
MARVGLIIVGASCLAGLFACQTTVPIYPGNQLYAANCSGCHGNFGEGDGPVSAVLKIPMQDLRYLAARNAGDFPRELIAKIIDGRELRVAHGRRQMPVWGEEFLIMEGFDAAAEERVSAKTNALVDHLETIQQLSD